MSTEERVEKLEDQFNNESEESLEPEKPIQTCLFCCNEDNQPNSEYNREGKRSLTSLYNDICRHMYQKIENKTIPRVNDPTKCTHDNGGSLDLQAVAKFINGAINEIVYLWKQAGILVYNIDNSIPGEIIKLISNKQTMEFVLLWHAKHGLDIMIRDFKESCKWSDILPYEEVIELADQAVKLDNEKALELIVNYKPDIVEGKTNELIDLLNQYIQQQNLTITLDNALEIIRNMDDEFLNSINPDDYYDYKKELGYGRHFAAQEQWTHNKHHLAKQHDEFKKWLAEAEENLGRKLDVKFLFTAEIGV